MAYIDDKPQILSGMQAAADLVRSRNRPASVGSSKVPVVSLTPVIESVR